MDWDGYPPSDCNTNMGSGEWEGCVEAALFQAKGTAAKADDKATPKAEKTEKKAEKPAEKKPETRLQNI